MSCSSPACNHRVSAHVEGVGVAKDTTSQFGSVHSLQEGPGRGWGADTDSLQQLYIALPPLQMTGDVKGVSREGGMGLPLCGGSAPLRWNCPVK